MRILSFIGVRFVKKRMIGDERYGKINNIKFKSRSNCEKTRRRCFIAFGNTNVNVVPQ